MSIFRGVGEDVCFGRSCDGELVLSLRDAEGNMQGFDFGS